MIMMMIIHYHLKKKMLITFTYLQTTSAFDSERNQLQSKISKFKIPSQGFYKSCIKTPEIK